MAFRMLTSHKALIFQMTSDRLSLEDAKNCKSEVFHQKHQYALIMLDLSKVTSVDELALESLAEMGKTLQAQNQRLMVIANEGLTQILDSKGYAETLPYYVGVAPVAPDDEGQTLPELDGKKFLNVVGPAVKENLRVYAKLDVTFGNPVVCTEKNRPHADMAGVGGFFCNHIKGNLLLSFQTDSFLKTVSAIMKREYHEVLPEISDWAAELVNSVLGKVKVDLKSKGYSFSAGIPTVFSGKDLEVFYSTKLPHSVDMVRCTGTFGEFYIEVMMADSE